MVNAENFLSEFLKLGLNHFTGVPDSTLKEWMTLLDNNQSVFENRIAANEGAAIAHAAGYHLATKKVSVVYLQNSGLGNCVSPLTSLTDPEVYSIPLIMVMGWRGRPGFKDEPQHKKMGAITVEILDALDIPYSILDSGTYKEQIESAKIGAEKNLKPYVLIVEPGFFHSTASEKINPSQVGINREIAIKCIVNSIDVDDLIVSTTGKASRELYEVSAKHPRGHNNNFYNVGSMGHVSSIGLEIALQRGDRKVYILDGDGALIMHMGSLSTIGYYQPKNLTHIIFDNESHESTGGQPTTSKTMNMSEILQGCNYENVNNIQLESELSSILLKQHQGLLGVVIKTQVGSRNDLGRPTDTPKTTKNRFMDGLASDD
ncbi:phosphonopyruvate decarboxylase [bacterium]|jgi:phosphonopyruvate decarboxylase|nr:phosphonopyruvate decarboxylase [bacterium]